MPAYNFQSQFVPMILEGSKIHTIRKPRKRPTKVNDNLFLYVGQRTKQSMLIARVRCIGVWPIEIDTVGFSARLKDQHGCWNLLLPYELTSIVKADGFDNVFDFFDFFRQRYEHGNLMMEIIEWDRYAIQNL